MSFSDPFIRRPIATTLLTLGLALAGMTAFFLLPVASLPNVDIPTIFVSASMAGASPETMSTSVATPLERHLGSIADVTEMTSSSSVGSTRIVLQFSLGRDIDGAARDVQAAINAARADLPASLKSNPTYRKLNPAAAPVMILALTSDTLTPGQIYDSASTVLQQKLSQVDGIGQVQVSGSSLPAVRVDLNPRALFKYGLALEDVRAALSAANANAPKGAIEQGAVKYQIAVNDQARTADQYRTLVVAYRDGAAIRLADIAKISDGVEDVRNIGMFNGKPAILMILSGQPGANVIATVDSVKALLTELQAAIPPSIKLAVANDRTGTIRASVHDVETTMAISIALVVFVVFLFLRNGRAALIPSVAVPLSLIGTFGVMYFAGFTLDNLSLMALTVATGFVVDDAHRRAREHHPPHRGRHEPLRGHAPGRARGRLHRALHEPVADRGLPADHADGRHRRALLQRVRDRAVGRGADLARRLADGDADAVRQSRPAQARPQAGLAGSGRPSAPSSARSGPTTARCDGRSITRATSCSSC